MPREEAIEEEHIPKFKLQSLPWGSAVIVLGKRRSGKTFFMKELIRHLDADMNLVFAGSDGSYTDFCEVTSPLHVYDAFSDVGIVDRVLSDLMLLMKDPATPRPRKIAIFLDDLGCDDIVMKSQIVLDLFARGRHMNTVNGEKIGLTIVVAIQYAKMIGPKIRSNTDYLFCYRLSSYECQTAVQKGYTTVMPARFASIMEDLHSNKRYASLVIDNSSDAQAERRGICWHRAKPETHVGEYTGSQEVNGLCARLFDKSFYREPALEEPRVKAKGRKRATAKVHFSDDEN